MRRERTDNQSNKVLSRAVYSGLSALTRLAKSRATKSTEKYAESIGRIWAEAREKYSEQKATKPHDFSAIRGAEPNMRRLYLKMLWESTRPYGNNESKRVYSWREGTVGPLNALLNYSGAQLRNLVLTRYPFPDPDYYQVREYADGHRVVLNRTTALSHTEDNVVKQYWKAGYRGNSRHPRVLLAHPTLPGLDFADMIRAHLVEMCRQCFIHNVPRSGSYRYIRLLMHRLRPFLDWVYTNGETGRKDFYPEADRELRRLVLEIRAIYGRRIGRSRRLTKQLEEEIPSEGVEFLRSKATRLLGSASDKATRNACRTVLDHIDLGNVSSEDIERFLNHVVACAQREGNDWHMVLLSDTARPFSLRSVVFGGDSMLHEPSDFLIASEVPVVSDLGRGKADVVVFVRREVGKHVVWTPIMLFEIKTRTAFDFNLYGFRPRTKKPDTYVPVLHAWTTKPKGWKEVIRQIPPKTSLGQVSAYEEGILSEYRKLVPNDLSAPLALWKGVVLVDTSQNYLKTTTAFRVILDDIIQGLITQRYDSTDWRSFYLEAHDDGNDDVPCVVVTLAPVKAPLYTLRTKKSLDRLPEKNPFENRVADDRILTLYVSVSSPTSSGPAAAWVSKLWHLLNHLDECFQSSPRKPRVLWLDLLGDFPTEELIGTRFGLKNLSKKGEITTSQLTELNTVLDTIRFVDLSKDINLCLLGGTEESLQGLASKITQSIGSNSGELIVILDGWNELTNLLTPNRKQLGQVLEHAILEWLPKRNVNIIWVDRGAPYPMVSGTYQRQCLSPLPYDSPRNFLLDEILWNLPTTPRVFGWRTPWREDIRAIVQDTPTSVPPWTTRIWVPHLRDWAKKIRGVTDRQPTVTEMEAVYDSVDTMYGRQVTLSNIRTDTSSLHQDSVALDLIPSLLRERVSGSTVEEPVSDESSPWKIVIIQADSQSSPIGLRERLHLNPLVAPPVPNRSGGRRMPLYVEADRINRGWLHKSLVTDQNEIIGRRYSRRPPLVERTEENAVDSGMTRRREVRRVLSAAQFLKRELPIHDNMQLLFDKIIDCCTRGLEAGEDFGYDFLDTLTAIEEILESDKESRSLWELLTPTRQELVDHLGSANQDMIQRISLTNPKVLFLYGNNLFLAVLAASEKVLMTDRSSLSIEAWESVAEWQLYQMGFQRNTSTAYTLQPKYDFQALYWNVVWRIKTLSSISAPETLLESSQFGQIVWTEDDGRFDLWLIIPDELTGQMVAGLVPDLSMPRLKWGFYRTVINPEQLFESAQRASTSSECMTVALTAVNNQKILWGQGGEEGDEWYPLGVLQFGSPPKGRIVPIRWLKISKVPERIMTDIAGNVPSKPPENIDSSSTEILTDISTRPIYTERVRCIVNIDIVQRVYRVEFKSHNTGRIIDSVDTHDTHELKSILRHPLATGLPLETDDGSLLVWDPLTDVDYSEVEISEGASIHLGFLKPFVRRAKFYAQEYVVPQTCDNLLRTTVGKEVNLVIRADESFLERGVFRCFRIEFRGPALGPRLRRLENMWLSIYDAALLAECEQIVDPDMGARYPTSLSIEGMNKLRISDRLSKYPRLFSLLREASPAEEEREVWWDELPDSDYEEPD
ncbi:MAG: hypothetical protein ACXADS_13560 [Candidatus Thorarchaeota archaeon]